MMSEAATEINRQRPYVRSVGRVAFGVLESASPTRPMNRPARLTLLGLVLCSALATALEAQESPLVLELHGGVAVPVRTFSDGTAVGEGAASGASFGIDFALPGGGRWTPYVGFSQHRFGCEDAGCAGGDPYVDTGFHVGFRITPLPGHRVLPWIRGGLQT